MSFKKNDGGKPKHSYLPKSALDRTSQVFAYGAKKYGRDNWLEACTEEDYRRYYDAAMRHMTAHNTGDKLDEESGLTHLSHACTNLMMLIEFEDIKEAKLLALEK